MISNKRLLKYFKTITFFLFISIIISCIILKPKIYLYSEYINEADFFESKDEYLAQNKCSPFFNDSKQFSVLIDNVKYPQRIALYENTTINFECLNSFKTPKTILMWNKFKGKPHIDYVYGIRRPFELLNCPVTSCELTNDRSKLKKSNLVLFHLRNQIDYIPNRVHSRQRFVHIILESPVHCHLCNKYENTFNATAGYNTNDYMSQYWSDSGLYYDLNKNFDTSKDFSSRKKGFVATLISNCDAKIRLDYIKELNKTINVTIYGKCGLNINNLCGPISKTKIDCREWLASNYKFFLAFENTVCENGYITEKFFNTLSFDIVVVALGSSGDYTKFIPKSGFIDARDFKTPTQLAQYLKYLNRNKTAYNEYFKWKKYLKTLKKNDNLLIKNDAVIPYQKDKVVLAGFLCEMCIQLNLERVTGEIKPQRIHSLQKMYGMNENCYGFNPEKFQFIKGDKSLKHSHFMSPE